MVFSSLGAAAGFLIQEEKEGCEKEDEEIKWERKASGKRREVSCERDFAL
jgi:hypothetical protein